MARLGACSVPGENARSAPLLDLAATQHFCEQEDVIARITATAAKVALAFSALVLYNRCQRRQHARADGVCERLHGLLQPARSRWPGVRRCMRANGLKLSKGCLSAPIAAGEVSKADVTRRAAAGK